jgi:hypothetical protein
MRTYGSATLAALQARTGIVSRVLVWFEARNRTTDAVETLGLWNGGDHAVITVDGTPRTYFGAGNIIDLPPVTYKAGLEVQMWRIGVSPITDEVKQLIRSYDPRFAAVEVHRVLFDPTTRAMIDTPHRVLAGFVDEVDLGTAVSGGEASCYLSIATSARALTYGLPNKNSDANQRRLADDRILRWGDVSGSVQVWWGAKRPEGA